MSESLPFRVAEFETVTEGLDYAARGTTGCNFFSSRGQLEHVLTYAEIQDRSVAYALHLAGFGLERGSRVALIAETTPDFLCLFYGCMYAGLVPVPLPLSINLGGHEAYVKRLRAMIDAAGASLALASEDMAPALREATLGSKMRFVGTPQGLMDSGSKGGTLAPLQKDEPCYVQYSSGSTSMPRGVLAMQRAVLSNARAIGQSGLQLRPGDRSASWLPLYHDMGLVGFCLTPMLSQVTIDYLATPSFARRPLLWLKIMSEQGSTISFSPTFGYDLCVRRATNGYAKGLDLKNWRVAGVGGEMVRGDVLDQFADRFACVGFDKRAFLPSYGLAESTLAVSFAPLRRGLEVDEIDREAYERHGEAVPVAPEAKATVSTRAFAKCGGPLPGHEVVIRGEGGEELPERAIGRVCVRGPSVMREYFQNVEATNSAVDEDDWLDTGDLGYFVQGQLVITGRSKDLIICNGRNIWPQDLEWHVEDLPGLRAGCVAGFSVDSKEEGERVVVVAECRLSAPEERRELVREMTWKIRKSAGVDCEIVLVPTRSLTFTSSGKLSRAAAKADYLAGRFEPLTIVASNRQVQSTEPYLAASAAS